LLGISRHQAGCVLIAQFALGRPVHQIAGRLWIDCHLTMLEAVEQCDADAAVDPLESTHGTGELPRAILL